MKSNSILSHVMFVLVVLALTACSGPLPIAPIVDGEIVALYPGTTQYIASQALEGAPGTQILFKENLVVFARYIEDGYGFVVVDSSAKAAVTDVSKVGGNLVNCKTWTEFKDWLTANGWQAIGPSLVTAWQWLFELANTALPTFYIMPSGFDYTQQTLDQMYGGVDQ